MTVYAVWALGRDRPGIVAAVTGGLFEAGANLLDTSMTILSGQFAMMLLVDAPDGVDEGGLEQALAAATVAFDLVVAARPVGAGVDAADAGAPHVVSVYGTDRPGLLHHVATALAAHDVNVTDVTTRVIGGDEPVYAMLLEVTLPATTDATVVGEALRTVASELGVDASIHAADADIL